VLLLPEVAVALAVKNLVLMLLVALVAVGTLLHLAQ